MAKKKMTIEELAAMTSNNFTHIERNIAKIEQTMATKDDLKLILSAVQNLDGKMDDIRQHKVSVMDHLRLESRVDRIEKRLHSKR